MHLMKTLNTLMRAENGLKQRCNVVALTTISHNQHKNYLYRLSETVQSLTAENMGFLPVHYSPVITKAKS